MSSTPTQPASMWTEYRPRKKKFFLGNDSKNVAKASLFGHLRYGHQRYDSIQGVSLLGKPGWILETLYLGSDLEKLGVTIFPYRKKYISVKNMPIT